MRAGWIAALIIMACFGGQPASAQSAGQNVPADDQIQEARAAMFQAEARYFSMVAAKLREVVASHAAVDEWWAEWWHGTYPSSNTVKK